MMNPSEQHSVSRLIADLKGGDRDAARDLWDRYYDRLVPIARRKLGPVARRVTDEEDLAISVFDSLFRGAVDGQFPRLADRTDLWQLMLAIATNKAVDTIRFANRQKRGGGAVRGDSIFESGGGFDQLVGEIDDPQLEVVLEEEHSRLLMLLRDDSLRRIVGWKLDGHTNEEISELLGVSVHSVGRKMNLIRRTWAQELGA